jgi:hypothetical protein
VAIAKQHRYLAVERLGNGQIWPVIAVEVSYRYLQTPCPKYDATVVKLPSNQAFHLC